MYYVYTVQFNYQYPIKCATTHHIQSKYSATFPCWDATELNRRNSRKITQLIFLHLNHIFHREFDALQNVNFSPSAGRQTEAHWPRHWGIMFSIILRNVCVDNAEGSHLTSTDFLVKN